MREIYEEALALARGATDEQLDDADWHGHLHKLAYSAERILAESVPEMSETDRWIVAREVAENWRPHEPIVNTVRRWVSESWKEMLVVDAKEQLLSTPINAYVLLQNHPDVRGSIRLNLFTHQVEVHDGALAGFSGIDAIVTKAQDWICSEYDVVIPHSDIGRRLVMVAEEWSFDPIRDYLLGLRWDGEPRVDRMLEYYAGAEADDPRYLAEVSRCFMVGAASRGLDPGSKVDMVLIAEGLQGLKKSAFFEVLGGPYYADASIALGDKDSKMLASSALILELPEMASFKRSDQNQLKAFLTTRSDTYRVPYGRGIVRIPRRCVFCTTTNDDHDYLPDPTGNRRYLPVKCSQTRIFELIRDRDQLWAEAVYRYRASETCPACAASTDTVWGQRPRCEAHRWWLGPEMAQIARREVARREETDVWTPAVLEWCRNPVKPDALGLRTSTEKVAITTPNILQYAVGKPLAQCGQADKIRVGRILRQAGYRIDKPHRGDRVYVLGEREPRAPELAIVE